MRLALEVVGVPEVVGGIEGGFARMQIAVFKQMGVEMNELRNYVVTEHLHGPTGGNTLNQRSGNLAGSVTPEVKNEDVSVLGLVGIPRASSAQKYARILHEGGTTRAHIIEAGTGLKHARFLAFEAANSNYTPWGLGGTGGMIFRRRVNHPGSHFPPRPYLLSALEEQAAQIKANLAAAMVEAAK